MVSVEHSDKHSVAVYAYLSCFACGRDTVGTIEVKMVWQMPWYWGYGGDAAAASKLWSLYDIQRNAA